MSGPSGGSGTSPGGPSPRLAGGSGLLAAAGLVAVITLAGRAVGLARWFVFSNAVGSTCVGEVYVTANQVPNVLYEIAVGGALAAVAVPLVSTQLKRGREDLADRTASAMLTWAVTLLLPLAMLTALGAGPIARLLLGDTPGCDPTSAHAAGRLMLLLLAPQILLYGIGVVLTGVLHAHRRFLTAAVAPLLSSLVVIATYLVFGWAHEPDRPLQDLPASALVILAGGTTLGVVALTLPLLVPAGGLGIRWRPTWRFPDGSGRAAGALALAGLAVVAAQQVAVVVMLLLTNRTEVGAVTVWTYAQTAYLLPYAVLVVPLATVAFPRLTPGSADAVPVLRRALTGALVASITGAAILVAAREAVGGAFLLLDAGAGGASRVTLEALPVALAWLAPGLVGYALLALLTRALYAVGRPALAAAPAVVGWAIAAVVPLVGAQPDLGSEHTLRWLALGSTLGMSVTGLLLLVQLRRTWGPEPLRGTGRTALVAGAGAAAGAGLAPLLPTPDDAWVPLLLTAAAGAVLVAGGAVLSLAVADRPALSLLRGKMPSSTEAAGKGLLR